MLDILDFQNKIVRETDTNLLMDLKNEKLPIVIWGGGSMSHSIKKILDNEKIKVSAYWIDNASIKIMDNGIKVYSYEEVCKVYDKLVVVLGHSKYELADKVAARPEIERIYCLVNVCYNQWSHLEYSFVDEHINDYFNTYRLMEDNLSRDCLIAFLNAKISEDYHYLLPVCKEDTATYFENSLFDIGNNEYLVDVGAYVGDTINEFVKKERMYKKIAAIEPDYKSVEKLKEYIKNYNINNVDIYEMGCWCENTELAFGEDEESSGISKEGTLQIKVMKLDDMLKNEDISIIKINYLYGVEECIMGAQQILKKKRPKLMIMVGFDEWALIKIPTLIKSINQEYKLALRFASAMPARLILFAY